jgi:predicted acyltransferase
VTSVAGAVVSAWLYPVLSIAVIWAVCAALLRRGVIVRV